MTRDDDWNPFFSAVIDGTTDGVDRLAEDFGASLEYWLDGVLNHPNYDDWQSEVRAFASHWRHYGVEVEPDSLEEIGRLIQSRVEGTGPFAPEQGEGVDIAQPVLPREIVFAAAVNPGGPRKKAPRPSAPKEKPIQPKPSRTRTPQSGTWTKGDATDGVFKLNSPIRLPNGRIVKAVPFRDGMPVFDKWALKGGDVLIAITGENKLDQDQAKMVWSGQHNKATIRPGYVMHHDGQVTQFVTHDGKQVFVGRMQAIPRELNKKLEHIGSASAAREYMLDKNVARAINKLASEGKGPLGKGARLLRKYLKKGSKMGRLIPIIGSAITIISFADDVEAHGAAGAVVRSAPLLGDLVTAYDLGTELADQIGAHAVENLEKAYRDANEPVRRAVAATDEDTIKAFNAVAANLQVTKPYLNADQIAEAIKEPLRQFYEDMYGVNFDLFQGKGTRYPAGAKHDEIANEDAFRMRMRIATERLERNLKEVLQTPEAIQGPIH